MFKLLVGTSGKFITIGICIFLHIQLGAMYEKIRGTFEGSITAGQMSSDGAEYLWAKMVSEGMVIDLIHYILYIIIFCVAWKIIATIYTNSFAFKEISRITKWR